MGNVVVYSGGVLLERKGGVMISPRWKKVLSDLIVNPTRTILVVMSIFIGVFAVGLITSAQAIIVREMRTTYTAATPEHASLSVGDTGGFDEDMLQAVRNMREVGDAEARYSYSVSAQAAIGDWRTLRLVAIDDFDDIRINKFSLTEGQWPPGDQEILIERSSLSQLQVEIGDSLLIERPDGKRRTLEVVGIVYAPTEIPAQFGGSVGYISMDTLEWISGERSFNQLAIISAENGNDITHNEAVAEEVYEKIQKSGYDVSFPFVGVPNEHPLEQFIGGMVAIMSILGVLAVFLSGFLVTNTISALLAQQVKQIGIMKSVGAQRNQIIQMYLTLVLCFGMIALLLAFPLSQVAAQGFRNWSPMSSTLNWSIPMCLCGSLRCRPLSACWCRCWRHCCPCGPVPTSPSARR